MTVRAVEWKQPYTWGTAIDIDENKVISLRLRAENNLIIYDEWDNEIYVDLQLPDEITPTDAFPVGITTGRVITDNGWDAIWTIICAKTTSGDNIKILYEDNWTLWIDNGTGTFKQIYFKADVDWIITTLTTYINWELAKKQNWVTSDTAPTDPAEWDLWYDTVNDALKVYDWTNWVATWWGWDVLVSDQAGNIFTSWMKIWWGTTTDYESLTPDSNTAYLLLADQPTPPSPSYTITWSTTVGSFTPWSFSDLQGFFISPDGENAYITFWNGWDGKMAQYSLSTPWDISTASQTQYISLTKPNGFCFSNDGTYMFYSTEDWMNIVRYSLSTPWDISTASQDSGQVLNVDSTHFALNVCLSDDGDYIWFGVDSLYKIIQYELTTPFDLTTATNQKVLNTSESAAAVMVKNDGKYMYKTKNWPVKQYELATPYDITSTATEIGSYSVTVWERRCLFVSNDCKYWTIGDNSGWITQFEAQPIS